MKDDLPNEQLNVLAEQLACLIRTLHDLSPGIAGFAVPPVFEGNVNRTYEATLKKLDFLSDFLTDGELALKRRRLSAFDLVPDITPVLGHQDLKAPNLLYDERSNRFSAVLDFQDCEVMDPAEEFTPLFDMSPGFAQQVVSHYTNDPSLKERISFFWFARDIQCMLKEFKRERRKKSNQNHQRIVAPCINSESRTC